MKVISVIILIALYGFIIYKGVMYAKERRAKRMKFLGKLADCIEDDEDEEE